VGSLAGGTEPGSRTSARTSETCSSAPDNREGHVQGLVSHSTWQEDDRALEVGTVRRYTPNLGGGPLEEALNDLGARASLGADHHVYVSPLAETHRLHQSSATRDGRVQCFYTTTGRFMLLFCKELLSLSLTHAAVGRPRA
jgi:hypothetical protein